MKRLMLGFALLLPVPASPQQDARTPAEKFEQHQKAQKAAEKERLKSPAFVQIKAPSEGVAALVIQKMSGLNFRLTDEGKHRLTFQQEMGWSGGPRRTVTFTVSEVAGVTTLAADLSIETQNAFGKVRRQDMNRNKKWRSDVEALLDVVKHHAEKPPANPQTP